MRLFKLPVENLLKSPNPCHRFRRNHKRDESPSLTLLYGKLSIRTLYVKKKNELFADSVKIPIKSKPHLDYQKNLILGCFDG
jgi:hypothetical protein